MADSVADDLEDHLTLLLCLLICRTRMQKRKRLRRIWICPIFAQRGEYHNLFQELRLGDPDSHFYYLRMSKERFDYILLKVSLCF